MNELRMYVEHLFQGKVLTAENIELKEEIYGNLVARYEDLLSEGVGEAEALARTKESFTSLDDVFADGADAARPGGPTPIAEQTAAILHPQPEQPVKCRRVWPLVLVSVVGILIFLAIGIMGCNMMAGISSLEHYASSQDEPIEPQGNGGGDLVANGSGTATPAIPSDEGVYVDPNGPVYFDGEPADDLVRAVVGSSSNDVLAQSDAGMDDVDALNTLIFNLPMGEWAENLDVTRGNGVLHFDYVRVPDHFDGDSIDLALAYNATALFCAVSDARKIQVTVSESDDVNENDCYVFERAAVEKAYGVPLNADMVNEEGWKQLKNDNLYQHVFAEHLVDRAESAAR